MTESTEEIKNNPSDLQQESEINQRNSEVNNEINQDSESPANTEDIQKQLEEINDRYVRMYSDFENFRRRTAKEKLELLKTAGAEALKPFIPVLDDLERAIDNNQKSMDLEAIKSGFQLIKHKFDNAFKAQGITEINPMGQPFNVDFHEAITRMKAPEEDLKGCVIEVLEKGYMKDGYVLRFAKVVVGD
jgi:molecular chaperone GrpE